MKHKTFIAGILTVLGRAATSKRSYALAICVLISIAAAALYVTRLRSVAYTLDLQVSRFSTTISDSKSKRSREASFEVPAGLVTSVVEGLTTLKTGQSIVLSDGPVGLHFNPPQRAIPTIILPDKASLTVETHIAEGSVVTLRPAIAAAELSIIATSGSVSISGRDDQPQLLKVDGQPIVLDGTISPGRGAVTIYLTPAEAQASCKLDESPQYAAPNLEHLIVSSMSFARVSDQTSLTAASTVFEGTLRFPSLGTEMRIGRGDFINVAFKTARLNYVRISACAIFLQLAGDAEILQVGSGSELKDVRPTYLEAAVHDKEIGFVASALISMWGFLWGLRELFVRSKEDS